MTIKEMHYDFDLKLDKVASLTKENFNKAEKDWLLNEGIWVLLKTKYGIANKYRAGFEMTQKRIDDLSTLHVKYPDQPGLQPIVHDNSVLELPLENLKYKYLYLTRGYADVIYSNCSKKVSLREIQNDDLNTVLQDPFNKSSIDNFIVVNFGKSSESSGASIYIYPDTLNIGKIYLEYLKHPARVSFGGYTYIDGVEYPEQDCDLPEGVHPEVVDTAVAIAAGIIEHPNYVQLKQMKLFNLSE